MFSKEQYLDNEDNNYHTENGIALANEFGTPEEQKLMAQIQKDHYDRGHINPDEIEARNAIVKKYYPMLEGKYKSDAQRKAVHAAKAEKVTEAGGYYTQPVYDMIEKHGINKVMHELLTALDADVIQDALSRMNNNKTNEGTEGCADCEWIASETDGDITTCDECAAEMNEGTEMGNIGDVSVKQFASKDGIAIQLTGSEGYVQLSREEAAQLAARLAKWAGSKDMAMPGEYESVQYESGLRSAVRETEKRWKQTSMSPEEAEAKYGKENVRVKKGGLRNGDDMVSVLVEKRANIPTKPTKPKTGTQPDQPSPQPQMDPPTQPSPTQPDMDPIQPSPTQPDQPSPDRDPMDPIQPKRKLRPRKEIYASKMALAGKLKEKIFRAATENEKQINELDLYAPNTDYIRAPNGEYFKVDYRNTGTVTGGGHKRADLTAFKNVVKADPKEVDVLGLDSRLDYADSDGSGIKSKKSNEIHVGHEHQGGSPFSDKDISVYDMDSEDYHNNVPDGAKAAVIKFMTQQQDESAKSERRLRITDWIQKRK